jgi:6-phosphogluconolactonase
VAHQIVPWKKGAQEAHIFSTKVELIHFTVSRFIELSEKAISERGLFSAVLSGGQTPGILYEELGRSRTAPDWRVIHVFQADERWVPTRDDRSNLAMIKRALLDRVPILPVNIHMVETDLPDSETAAMKYEEAMRQFFGCALDGFPVFDLMLLGLGEDGHTASLFPGSSVLADKDRIVRAVPPEGDRLARVTVTLPLINSSRHIFFFVTGLKKASAVRQLFEGRGALIPASLVDPFHGRVTLLCDEEAASLIG